MRIWRRPWRGFKLPGIGACTTLMDDSNLRGSQSAPATLNLQTRDPDAAGLNLIRGQVEQLAIEYALSNGFGFAGVKASVLFKRWD